MDMHRSRGKRIEELTVVRPSRVSPVTFRQLEEFWEDEKW